MISHTFKINNHIFSPIFTNINSHMHPYITLFQSTREKIFTSNFAKATYQNLYTAIRHDAHRGRLKSTKR